MDATMNDNDDVYEDVMNIQNEGIPTSNPPATKLPKSSPRPPKPKNIFNPLHSGILNYLKNHQDQLNIHTSPDPVSLTIPLPKRFTIYPPLLLLPSNAFSSPPEWAALYNTLSSAQRQELYACIAASFASKEVTHIAMNAPIAPTMTTTAATGIENRIRSPSGLVPLYGDFGEGSNDDDDDHEGGECDDAEEKEAYPTEAALQSVLWVRAVQNRGIVQIWAPLHSMFSRGNVVEKARILGIESRFAGLDDGGDDGHIGDGQGEAEGKRLLGQRVGDIAVVDMYAGIGYFVFSYLKRGVGRVWGWEINGWSVEGLCRGCKDNGWGVKVVKVDKKTGEIEGGIDELVMGLREEDRVVVFHGDNKFAADVLSALKEELQQRKMWKRIRHVNLGLLPTSRPAWDGAVKVLDMETGGWIHVHENVDMKDIGMMEEDIVQEINSLLRSSRGSGQLPPASHPFIPTAKCIHVERVKTYAPGVMHCVFDVYIPPSPGWLESGNRLT
ncbi:tRNA wybutosine-synthesizing protein 2 [Blastomyces parvus]|uniref:tRNA wybutosine-synthesizing protein 2 n=1 Tax=Blastomyces parvus TaxID=2060905 RepID=A0A2B7XNH5_9EURO|nr:tRNA wybutosine-synthesizing protein 2 [Blastomyces parvus]